MSDPDTPPAALPITTYLEDGARLAAIVLIWGILSLFATYGLGEVGGPGSMLGTVGPWLGDVLMQAGLLNAVIYVLYRTIDYWRRREPRSVD